MSKYDGLENADLIRLLERRDRERQLGLVWERDDLESDQAVNDDFVALTLDATLSHGDAPWDNLIIEGDNFDALRALRMTHAGRVRCIYIDPPYNTGNRDFVYNDRFVDKTHRFRHSLWLEFMYRRLMLARDLLSDDGVIFVSIDDNELFRLGMLMDRVFGVENKLACFAWQTDGNFDNQAKIKICHEYVLAYTPRPDLFPMPKVVDPNIGEDSKLHRPEIRNTIVKNGPKNPVCEIVLPAGFPATFESGSIAARQDKWPQIDREIRVSNWRTEDSVVLKSGWANRGICQSFIDGGLMPIQDSKGQATRFVLTESGAVENVKQRAEPSHVISVLRNLGNTQADGAMLAEMGIAFTYPKPVSMIRYLLSIVDDKEAITLDFFAGSGTTAHAIAKLNREDGGRRRFILVSSTETTIEEPDKNICRDICAKRVRNVLAGYSTTKGANVKGLGGSFAYLRARRIPAHRISTRIEHAEVWSALQLLHEFPVSIYGKAALHSVRRDALAMAYVAIDTEATNSSLSAWLAQVPHAQAVVYSWTPERYRHLAPEAAWSPIPDALRARFAR